jgi:F0F1-type ATP synthase membrane subunit b/b'
MLNENVENMKADAKNAVSDIGNIMSHAKADAKADVEKVKAKFGHGDKLEKKAAYAKADIKADASKAKADVGNKMVHAKADAEKAKANMGNKMADARRRRLMH